MGCNLFHHIYIHDETLGGALSTKTVKHWPTWIVSLSWSCQSVLKLCHSSSAWGDLREKPLSHFFGMFPPWALIQSNSLKLFTVVKFHFVIHMWNTQRGLLTLYYIIIKIFESVCIIPWRLWAVILLIHRKYSFSSCALERSRPIPVLFLRLFFSFGKGFFHQLLNKFQVFRFQVLIRHTRIHKCMSKVGSQEGKKTEKGLKYSTIKLQLFSLFFLRLLYWVE